MNHGPGPSELMMLTGPADARIRTNVTAPTWQHQRDKRARNFGVQPAAPCPSCFPIVNLSALCDTAGPRWLGKQRKHFRVENDATKEFFLKFDRSEWIILEEVKTGNIAELIKVNGLYYKMWMWLDWSNWMDYTIKSEIAKCEVIYMLLNWSNCVVVVYY